jgi:hypothetical protein
VSAAASEPFFVSKIAKLFKRPGNRFFMKKPAENQILLNSRIAPPFYFDNFAFFFASLGSGFFGPKGDFRKRASPKNAVRRAFAKNRRLFSKTNMQKCGFVSTPTTG